MSENVKVWPERNSWHGIEHVVYVDDDWAASFRKKEDAEEYADQKRLEP